MRVDRFTTPARRALAALLLAATAGCGGGGIGDLFVKFVTARVVPATVTLSPGASTSVDLEVSCYSGAWTGRAYLDPGANVPTGISATLPDPVFFNQVPGDYICDTQTEDSDRRIAHIPVVVAVAVGTPPQSVVLRFVVDSTDVTFTELTVRVSEATTPG